jgi:hypothetical protein
MNFVRVFFIIFVITLLNLNTLSGQPAVLINEVVSSNITGLPDEYEVDLQNCPVVDCEQWYEDLGESVYDGEYPDWIELYNAGSVEINLNGYGLSDNPQQPYKWTFQNGTLAPGEYLIVFASGKNKTETYIHTNFKLDRSGETIVLTDINGLLCDSITTREIPIDYSLGRLPDATDSLVIFVNPTPGEVNNGLIFPGYLDVINPSHKGGFYSGAISLQLEKINSSSDLFYTTDGSDPDINSSLYTGPVPVDQTIVVKAKSFLDGVPVSKTFTATYFIDQGYSFPVFSVSTNPGYLFDENTGIYVPGANADENNRIANYWNDWERPAHIEMFEPGGDSAAFSIDAGIKIHGWGTRSNPQKSLAVMLRDKYGAAEIDYPLFPGLEVSSFKSFILRSGGTDWNKMFFRDAFAQQLISERNVDQQAFRPAIVFINGEYYGIQNIREKLNEDYLASHHGIDKDNVDIISRYWRRTYPIVVEGDDAAYLELENYLENTNMQSEESFNYIKSVIDIDNLLDYLALQIFCANYDWPGNNNKAWKSKIPDAKWRWLMYDLDWTFNLEDNNPATHNTLDHATNPNGFGWPSPNWTTLLLRRLFLNRSFQEAFSNRIADYLNTIFKEENATLLLDNMADIFRPELLAHIDRWGEISSLSAWEDEIEKVKIFLGDRRTNVLSHIRTKFSLDGWRNLNLNSVTPSAGKIKINSILVENFPWSGIYFQGIPVRVTAIPNAGFKFIGWQGSDESSNSITITLNGSQSLTALFEVEENAINSIVINEINYNSPAASNPGDWVEFYNGYNNPIDISGWKFKDSNPENYFSFPEGSVIETNNFLVLCRDTTMFKSIFPQAGGFIGNMDFNLSNGSEHIRLIDDQNQIIDSLTYSDSTPWPVQADGDGATLALINPAGDNADPLNWSISIYNLGTPGYFNDGTINSVNNPAYKNLPAQPELMNNYPNPFNPKTMINFALPEKMKVRLNIYNILGQHIKEIINKELPAGFHQVNFEAGNLPSGIYICRLKTNNKTVSKRMLYLK